MKREIKLKAWNKKEQRFVPISKIHTDIDNATLTGVNETWSGFYYSMHEIAFIQYTGLNYASGGEIYEGDIIEYDNSIKAVIVFSNGAFCAYDGYANNSDEAYLSITHDTPPFEEPKFTFKKIGTIHENPELLIK